MLIWAFFSLTPRPEVQTPNVRGSGPVVGLFGVKLKNRICKICKNSKIYKIGRSAKYAEYAKFAEYINYTIGTGDTT